MEKIFASFADAYDRKARLMPAVLSLLPVLLAVGLYTDWLNLDWEDTLPGFVAVGVLFWLVRHVRILGKRKEDALLQKDGPLPSVRRLRHRDPTLDRHTKKRYHRAVELVVADLRMLDAVSEARDPEDADERYRAVVQALLPLTRDKKRFPLLFMELTNYGFQRNMLGAKPMALVLIAAVATFCVWRDWPMILTQGFPDGRELAIIAVCFLLATFWLLSVTEQSVREVSDAYAKQLHEALDDLAREKRPSAA